MGQPDGARPLGLKSSKNMMSQVLVQGLGFRLKGHKGMKSGNGKDNGRFHLRFRASGFGHRV